MTQLDLLDDGDLYHVEVWVPVAQTWIPLSRVHPGRYGPTSKAEAEQQAAEWVASGAVIDPKARAAPLAR